MRSFAKDYRGPIPARDQCFLSLRSICKLGDDCGLSIVEDDFLDPVMCNLENLPKIADAMMSDNDVLQEECTIFLYRVLKDVSDPPIQWIIDLEVVPQLVEFLEPEEKPSFELYAASALGLIALEGTDAHTQAVVDAGAVPKLVSLLTNAKRINAAGNSAKALGRIAMQSTSFRDVVLQAGAMTPLFRLTTMRSDSKALKTTLTALKRLCSGQPRPNFTGVEPCLEPLTQHLFTDEEELLSYACQAFSYLSCVSIEQAEAVIGANVFPRLLELASHSSQKVQESALKTIKFLVLKDKSQIQVYIDNNAIPSLVSCISSSVEEVQKEACLLMSLLLIGTRQQVAVVTQGCVRALCSVLNSSNPGLLYALKGFTNVRPMFCLFREID